MTIAAANDVLVRWGDGWLSLTGWGKFWLLLFLLAVLQIGDRKK